MSEQEKKGSGNIIGGSSVVMVEQTTANRHKQPYRPTDLKEEPLQDVQHKRSRAPAVPPVEEELKDSTDKPGSQDRRESERAISFDKQKHSIAQKLSASTRKRDVSPEAITLAPIEVERQRESTKHLPQPIPAQVSAALDASPSSAAKKNANDDNDSITEEIAELRIPEVTQKSSEWFDDEEAGGLPRSESRASRVSRVVRQLFCCGMPYETPSEENMSTRRGFDAI